MSAPEYCFLWIDWWPLCMTKAEWSGWVQAIGAVIAILAGAYAVWYQVRRARVATLEFQRADDVRKLKLIAVANLGCIQALKVARLQVADIQLFTRTFEGFQAQCDVLAEVPLLEIPDVWVAMIKSRAVQERERLSEKIAAAHSANARIDAIELSLREFIECERVVGAALAQHGAELPYSTLVGAGGMVLHQRPDSFELKVSPG